MPAPKLKPIEERDPYAAKVLTYYDALQNGLDYRTLKIGDTVDTHYGVGTVVNKRGETFIEFDDGSGASIWEATRLIKAGDIK